MPQQKDLKRIVRSRMQKTGESYTAARHQITSSRKTKGKTPEPRPDYTSLAGFSDEAIEKPTGRNWPQWVELLDAWGAAQKPHREISAYVSSIGVPSWWT